MGNEESYIVSQHLAETIPDGKWGIIHISENLWNRRIDSLHLYDLWGLATGDRCRSLKKQLLRLHPPHSHCIVSRHNFSSRSLNQRSRVSPRPIYHNYGQSGSLIRTSSDGCPMLEVGSGSWPIGNQLVSVFNSDSSGPKMSLTARRYDRIFPCFTSSI